MNSSTLDARGRAGVPQDVRERAGFDDGDEGKILWKNYDEETGEIVIELQPDAE